MSRSPADSVTEKGVSTLVTEESAVGDKFEGESQKQIEVGVQEEVLVELFRRNVGPQIGTFFMRVTLRSKIVKNILMRYNVDMDRYTSESDFLRAVMIGAGALAEQDNETRGANWDADYVANQARKAAKELLHQIEKG